MSEAFPGAKEVFGSHADQAIRYAELLANEGVEWGLLGPREAERIWDRHVMNSAALVDVAGQGDLIVDVGSGAGLPGIVLALARPDVSVWLLEPMLRRVSFLSMVVDELDLGDQVCVVRGRAENPKQWEVIGGAEAPAAFDFVTCRAVAHLDRLVHWCWPLVDDGGALVALKGERAEDELRECKSSLVREGLLPMLISVRAWSDAEPTRAVKIVRDHSNS